MFVPSVAAALEQARTLGARLARARIARSVASGYVVVFVAAVAGIVRIPIILHHLGLTQYGLWAILLSLASYVSLGSLGLGPSLTRVVARATVRGDTVAASTAVALTAGFQVLVVAGLLFVIVPVSDVLVPLLKVGPASSGEFTLALYYASAGFGFRLVGETFYAALLGIDAKPTADMLRAAGHILDTIAYIGASIAFADLVSLTYFGALTGVLLLFMFLVVVSRAFPLKVSLSVAPQVVKDVARLSPWNLIMLAGGLVIFSTDNVVIAYVLGPAAVALYSVAFQAVSFCATLTFQISDGLQPTIALHYWGAREVQMRRALTLSADLSAFVGGFFTLVLVFFGPDLLAVWVGPEAFVGHSTWFILSTIPLLHGVVHSYASVWLMTGDLRPMALLNVLEAAANLGLSLWWASFWGVAGVALGTIAAQVVTNAWFLPWKLGRRAGLRGIPPVTTRPLAMVGLVLAVMLGWPSYQNRGLTIVGCAVALVVLVGWGFTLVSPKPGRPSAA
ncbi:MAG: polysaccharide biosynthesis C-terminal domain-containing protein [Gemmatimonadetes bacterium]|nr:polysaccharide biosynthesis C-terminal domain-containing protein [Gemmatimonadota bacterium]